MLACLILPAALLAPPPGWAEIRVVDSATGRGVPLVELETVDRELFVADNVGRVAINDPGLVGREVFFNVRSHGYEAKKDGFGYAGARVTLTPGTPVTIPVTRTNVAERLCRLTGRGQYRDTALLGHTPPRDAPLPGGVAGQDSVQAAPYRGKVFWFWGDTSRLGYPLGIFRTAGATTPPLPEPSDPADGIAFDYFVDKTGFARNMVPHEKEPAGVIWIDGVCTFPDDAGKDRLVCHYSRRKGLGEQYEHGVAVFDDEKMIFEPAKVRPADDTWRHPSGHATSHEADGKKWLLFGNPVPNVRVPATLAAVLDPARYESFTAADGPGEQAGPRLAGGRPVWRWQSELPPTHSPAEAQWLKAGSVKPEDARMTPTGADDERVTLHNGTTHWNPYRQRWLLLAGQIGGSASFLGEVWYAEAREPTGPFAKAVKVVTHDKQTFYNVCHHPFLDRAGGRVVHFEGTYTADFSGNPHRTPRYDYNQVLYRLDLDAPALAAARTE